MTTIGNVYFAYGSNLDPDQMAFRGLHFESVVGAVLPGYRLTFSFPARSRWLGTAADIEPDGTSSVEGALYHLSADITLMDDWEQGYRRVAVEVRVPDGGEPVPAWTYVAERKRPPGTSSEIYVGQMLKGARELGLSDGYIASLEEHLGEGQRELGDHVAAVRAMARSGRPLAMDELADTIDRPVDRVEEVLSDLGGWGWVEAFNEPPVFRVVEGKEERSPWILR